MNQNGALSSLRLMKQHCFITASSWRRQTLATPFMMWCTWVRCSAVFWAVDACTCFGWRRRALIRGRHHERCRSPSRQHAHFAAGDSITRHCVSWPTRAAVCAKHWGPNTGLRSAFLGVGGTTVEELTVRARCVSRRAAQRSGVHLALHPGRHQAAGKHDSSLYSRVLLSFAVAADGKRRATKNGTTGKLCFQHGFLAADARVSPTRSLEHPYTCR